MALVCLAFVVCVSQDAHAIPGLSFRGLVQTLNTGGSINLNSPSGIAVDTAGNILVADTGNSRIVEVDAEGAASVLTISGLSQALVSPTGIAVDESGNLYITDADPANSRLIKVTSAGAASVVTTGSVVLSSPTGVALDQSGDIFIADTGNNQVVEVASGGAASALSIAVSSGPATLTTPSGLAVDVSGSLYIADSVNNRIVKVAGGSSTGTVLAIAGGSHPLCTQGHRPRCLRRCLHRRYGQQPRPHRRSPGQWSSGSRHSHLFAQQIRRRFRPPPARYRHSRHTHPALHYRSLSLRCRQGIYCWG